MLSGAAAPDPGRGVNYLHATGRQLRRDVARAEEEAGCSDEGCGVGVGMSCGASRCSWPRLAALPAERRDVQTCLVSASQMADGGGPTRRVEAGAGGGGQGLADRTLGKQWLFPKRSAMLPPCPHHDTAPTQLRRRRARAVGGRRACRAVTELRSSSRSKSELERALAQVEALSARIQKRWMAGRPLRAQAAERLEVSEPTVRKWLTEGLLERVEGRKPVEISQPSVIEVERILQGVRESYPARNGARRLRPSFTTATCSANDPSQGHRAVQAPRIVER